MFLAALWYGAWINFVYTRQCKYAAKQSYVMLAIDIPKNNLQTPRAVENIFCAIGGMQTPLDWHEKYLKGEFQLGMSLEIVSIDGFIQYLIRTPTQYRNLVEAAIYSQYPEAEVTEVSDYAAEVTTKFPSDEYNLWGADLVLTNKEYFPIRTYIEFQEELDKEFKDPMAAMLEVMSKIGPGEQIWFQIMIAPADIGWEKQGIKAVNKLLGIEAKSKETVLDKITDMPLNAISMAGEILAGAELTASKADEKKQEKFNMMFLDPIKKREVEALLRKIDKNCFKTKVRFIYYGKREVFKKGLGVSGMFGAIKQFGSTALNGFKPGKNKTQAKLAFIGVRMARKQNDILKNYKKRNPDSCSGGYLLSVEELATLYHFPYIEIRTPLVKRIAAKKGQAPIGLPVEGKKFIEEEAAPLKTAGEREVPVIDYDSDYFEKRFAKDKSGEADRKRKEMIMSQIGKKKPEQKKPKEVVVEFNLDGKIEKNEKSEKKKNGSAPGNLPFIQ